MKKNRRYGGLQNDFNKTETVEHANFIYVAIHSIASKHELRPKPDTAIVHTTTPKTITGNGAIRKRSPEWSNLKTILFENVVS